jgi:hypothetical protein
MKSIQYFFIFVSSFCIAQEQTLISEENEVKETIHQLFEGMYNGDSSLVHSVFHSSNRLMTCYIDKNGMEQLAEENLQDFLDAVGSPHEEIWDEKITFTSVLVDLHLAQVWTEYQFYLDNEFSHCGVNAFQLVKENGNWKIIQLIDTRKRDNCLNTNETR